MLRKSFAIIAVALSLSAVAHASPDAYPSKPVKLIVPYSAGGSTDNIARLLAERLRMELKQPVIVENRPGGNNLIAARALLASPPDGYTLMLATNGLLSVAPALYTRLPSNPVDGFSHLGFISGYPYVVVTRADQKQTLQDYITRARSKPNSVSYMVVGNVTAVAGAMLKARSKTELTEIRYKGGADAISDLVAGRVDFGLVAPSVASPLMKAGKLSALAVTTKTRVSTMPNVQTVSEEVAGMEDYHVDVWSSLIAPPGLPQPIANRIAEALAKVTKDPGFAADLAKNGEYPIQGGPADVKARVSREIPMWKSVVASTGMSPVE
ncbi:tripartite tricarboxylate transporter substrate binding protein [Cupriavidus sp. IK-TO18]|uniref:Bug family tripartite tricarboxylate transporter substrate binding protein n=1 Tax=Cupriavidus sp. IK-TO18 TaxID=2782182 RepID=UPI001899A751|nr:tripartite tricarboxylate transporter substrate binding protein [Cupriavidus sp. IK-TO18]MBF6989159.1 tripartite tricarboxylate transporter substrate binding protein [Cupriavidus sp. IK-TO18]